MIEILEPTHFSDDRGDLWTLWNKNFFTPNIEFVHDKIATSKKNVLRGLHGDNKSWKLISCLYGEIFLSVVNYDKNSSDYLKTDNFILNDVNKKIILVPPNFLNGHLVLSENCVFFYKWAYEGEYPDVNDQFSIRWNDPILKINWPISEPILSERDKNAPFIL